MDVGGVHRDRTRWTNQSIEQHPAIPVDDRDIDNLSIVTQTGRLGVQKDDARLVEDLCCPDLRCVAVFSIDG
jgi:hypothetical protein